MPELRELRPLRGPCPRGTRVRQLRIRRRRGPRGPRARLDDVRRGRPDPCGSAALRDGARQRARLYGRKWPSGCEGNPIDARSVAALNRLRRVSRWTRYDRTERALAPGLAQLSSLSSRLGLAPALRERAAIPLRRALEAGPSRGRSLDATVAAVVHP